MRTLSEDLEDLLEAERDIDVPAPAQRKRMFSRLEPLLLVPAALAAGSASTAAATNATGSAAVGSVLKGKIAAAVISAAVLGGVVGATGQAYFAAAPARSPVAPSVPLLSARPSAVPSALAKARSAPDEPAPAASATTAPSQGGGRQERPRPFGSLRAERLLIETASAALMRGDSESALLALRQHARQFPNGSLAQEREVLLARAFAARAPR
jgi:hypothetical protein